VEPDARVIQDCAVERVIDDLLVATGMDAVERARSEVSEKRKEYARRRLR
jgi:hypothetical protein